MKLIGVFMLLLVLQHDRISCERYFRRKHHWKTSTMKRSEIFVPLALMNSTITTPTQGHVTSRSQNATTDALQGIKSLHAQEESEEAAEKRSKLHQGVTAQKRHWLLKRKYPVEGDVNLRTIEEKGKPLSAIVVIGNKTHRISGPVVKALLADVKKNEEEETKQTIVSEAQQRQHDETPSEIGQSGSTNANNPKLKRLHAANEVAEINKLLGKPLTDEKALSFIKTLLLRQVHTDLAKTMEQKPNELGVENKNQFSNVLPPSNPVPAQLKEGVLGPLHPPAKITHLNGPALCKDMEPKERCSYLKELGLCLSAGKKNKDVRKRCQEMCTICDSYQPCVDCNDLCVGCTVEMQSPPAPPPPPPPPPLPPPPLPPPPPPPPALSPPSPYKAYPVQKPPCCSGNPQQPCSHHHQQQPCAEEPCTDDECDTHHHSHHHHRPDRPAACELCGEEHTNMLDNSAHAANPFDAHVDDPDHINGELNDHRQGNMQTTPLPSATNRPLHTARVQRMTSPPHGLLDDPQPSLLHSTLMPKMTQSAVDQLLGTTPPTTEVTNGQRLQQSLHNSHRDVNNALSATDDLNAADNNLQAHLGSAMNSLTNDPHKSEQGLLHPTQPPIRPLHAKDLEREDLETTNSALGHVSTMATANNALLDGQQTGQHTSNNALLDGQQTGQHTSNNALLDGQQTGQHTSNNAFLDNQLSSHHTHSGLHNTAQMNHAVDEVDTPHETNTAFGTQQRPVQDPILSQPTISPTGVTSPLSHVTAADQSHVTVAGLHPPNLLPTVTPDAVSNEPTDSQYEPCSMQGNGHLHHQQQHLQNSPCSSLGEHAVSNLNPTDISVPHVQHDPTRPNPVHPVNPLLDPDNPLHQTTPIDILDIDPIRVQELNLRRPENVLIGGQCSLAIDIGIAVDISAAAAQHWQQLKHFITSLLTRFLSIGRTHFGIITFSTIAKLEIPLGNQKFNLATLTQRLDKIQPHLQAMQRRTDSALDVAKEMFLNSRPGVTKVLILIEHGGIRGGDPSVDWRALEEEPAERLRNIGVNIFVVSTTPIADLEEMQAISGSESHSIQLQGYQQLQVIIPPLVRKVCNIASVVKRSERPHDPKDDEKKSRKDCGINFKKIGCFKDDQNSPRPLPVEILNDIGHNYPAFSGQYIDWDHWNKYYKNFICRCATEAQRNGYKVFGVQGFASCRSGVNAHETYNQDGRAKKDRCITRNYQKCSMIDPLCVGKNETNFVYRIN